MTRPAPTATATALVLDGVTAWRHDLAGCLHACAATLLGAQGVEPLESLGAAWSFLHIPAELRREEYYFPCRPGESLFAALAPYHPVRSRWHEAPDAEHGWAEVRAAVAAGTPVAVAVDNFHLPFRPAYQDVHANHLIIVYGFDDAAGTARVLDTVPPRYDGDLDLGHLAAARDSGNRSEHRRDMFFADQPIGNRWLEAEVDLAAFPAFDRDTIRDVIRRNLDGYADPAPVDAAGRVYAGLAGLADFLGDAGDRLADGGPIADELFVAAGAVLAGTALHADWLAHAARRLASVELAEAGRRVERVAHHWTAVRIMAALSRSGDVPAPRLARRAAALLEDQRRALTELDHVLAHL
jgi:hypothetical protein